MHAVINILDNQTRENSTMSDTLAAERMQPLGVGHADLELHILSFPNCFRMNCRQLLATVACFSFRKQAVEL